MCTFMQIYANLFMCVKNNTNVNKLMQEWHIFEQIGIQFVQLYAVLFIFMRVNLCNFVQLCANSNLWNILHKLEQIYTNKIHNCINWNSILWNYVSLLFWFMLFCLLAQIVTKVWIKVQKSTKCFFILFNFM